MSIAEKRVLRRESSDVDAIGKNINERKRRIHSEYHPKVLDQTNTQVEEELIKSASNYCQVNPTYIVSPFEGSRKSTSETVSQTGNDKRHSYRTKSSGYGTGSSLESREEVFNNDVFEDIYTASAQADALNSSVCKSENEGGTRHNFNEMGVQDAQFLSRKESSDCSSNSSNVTVLDTSNLSTGDILLCSAVNRSKSMSSRKLYKPREDISHYNESGPSERLLSNEETSFEIQIPATSDDNICAAENPMNDTAPNETTDFNSLFDDVSLLRKYISEQQNSPIYAPNGKVNILPDEGMHQESLSSAKDETLQSGSREWLHSSVRGSDDCFCSILPSSDIHIPQNEMEKMYNSAMRRLDKQILQQDLQKILAAIDGEEKTMSIIFQEDQYSEDFLSSIRATQESCPSNMDTIDKILQQVRAKEHDLSISKDVMAAQSVDELQAPVAFPDEKVTSPHVPFALENEENRELLLRRLYMAALCLDNVCSNFECSMGQELLEHLKERLEQNLTYESSSCQQMLKTIAWHAEVCEEMKCPLPYCNFFQETDIPFSEQIARLQQTFFSYIMEITEQPTKTDKFWKVNSRVPVDKALQEGVDWSVVSKMGYFGQGPYLVQSSIYQPSTLDIQDYWVVKKISLDEEKAEDKAKLLHTICGIGQEHIIPLLWLLYQPSSFYVCSQFEGMSVSEYLKGKERGLGRDFTLTYLQQLTKAAGYLHTRSILYLNWTCDHVVIDNDRVKLCNLTSAVVCSGIEYDEDMLEDVMMTLPPHVLPPELLELSSIGAYSDIWGLGCIAHEMHCGTRVHDDLRHCDLSSQRDKIRRSPVPDLSRIKDGVLLNILNLTLQIKYEDRPSCCAIQTLLDRQINAIR